MDGRVGVHRSCNHLHLRGNFTCLGLVGGEECQATRSFTIQTKVLSKGLEEAESVGIVRKHAQSMSILLKAAGSEALVGTVEGAEVVFAHHNLEDLAPLLFSGVAAGGVVGAGMKHDDLSIFSLVQILEHSVDVEVFVLAVVVAVSFNLESRSEAYSSVGGPGRVGDVDLRIFVSIPFLEEVKADTEGASSRKSLHGGISFVLYHGAVLSKS